MAGVYLMLLITGHNWADPYTFPSQRAPSLIRDDDTNI